LQTKQEKGGGRKVKMESTHKPGKEREKFDGTTLVLNFKENEVCLSMKKTKGCFKNCISAFYKKKLQEC
jgi:hypothetical protein